MRSMQLRIKRWPSLKRVSHIKSLNLIRIGGMGAEAPEIRVRENSLDNK